MATVVVGSYTAVVDESYETFVHKIDATGNMLSGECIFLVSFERDASESLALEAVRVVAPANIGSAYLQSLEIEEMLTLSRYKVRVEYSEDAQNNSTDIEVDEEPTVSFNCGGGTRHIKRALSQRCYYAPGVNYNDYVEISNGINWNGVLGREARFDGVDVPCANLQETYTKRMKIADLSTAFRRKVAAMTGCVNSTKFKGWLPGEVMFLGCSFSGVDKKKTIVSVNFNFSIKINETNVSIDGIDVGNVDGWDYVWGIPRRFANYSASNTESANNHIYFGGFTSVYVARIAKRVDFSNLGI